jgi:hypothetical protein
MGMNRSVFSTLVELIGIGSLVIGIGMLSIPVAMIVGGSLLVLLGAALGRSDS